MVWGLMAIAPFLWMMVKFFVFMLSVWLILTIAGPRRTPYQEYRYPQYRARVYGDWRELFRSVDRIDAVTKADIRRVANQVFVPTNRTVGIIETATAGSGGAQ